MNKDRDLIEEAEKIMEAKDIKTALKDLREYLMDDVALTAKSMYDSLLRAGMTEEQAHDITKDYVIDMCRLQWQRGEPYPNDYDDDFIDFDDDEDF